MIERLSSKKSACLTIVNVKSVKKIRKLMQHIIFFLTTNMKQFEFKWTIFFYSVVISLVTWKLELLFEKGHTWFATVPFKPFLIINVEDIFVCIVWRCLLLNMSYIINHKCEGWCIENPQMKIYNFQTENHGDLIHSLSDNTVKLKMESQMKLRPWIL